MANAELSKNVDLQFYITFYKDNFDYLNKHSGRFEKFGAST